MRQSKTGVEIPDLTSRVVASCEEVRQAIVSRLSLTLDHVRGPAILPGTGTVRQGRGDANNSGDASERSLLAQSPRARCSACMSVARSLPLHKHPLTLTHLAPVLHLSVVLRLPFLLELRVPLPLHPLATHVLRDIIVTPWLDHSHHCRQRQDRWISAAARQRDASRRPSRQRAVWIRGCERRRWRRWLW